MPLSRLHVPLLKPEDVIPHLGKGELHWRDGFSAKSACLSWANARDIPAPVRAVLDQAADYRGAELLDAWLERCTPLPWGKGNPSQTDLLALIGIGDEIAVLGIEAKVREPFGPTVTEWLAQGGSNRIDRLDGLRGVFGISAEVAMGLRYQLFHRVAASMLEAKRFRAKKAAVLVQSFCPDRTGLADFQAFADAAGFGRVEPDGISGEKDVAGVTMRVGWVADGVG